MAEARWAVLAVVLCGQLAAGAAGVLPLPLALGSALLAVAATGLAATAAPARHAALRTASSVVALVLVLATVLLSGGALAAGPVLVPLLAGVAGASALRWLTPRELRSGLLCGGALLVASAAWSRDLLVAPPLLLGWVALLVALLRLPRLRLADGDVVRAPGAPRRLPLLPAVALAVVLALAAALLLPDPGAPVAAPLGGADRAPGEATQARSARGGFSSPVLDLGQRIGTPSSAPVLEVPSDSPRLWRARVYADYDGRTWSVGDLDGTALPGPPYALPADVDGPVRRDTAVTADHDGTVWAPGEVRELGPGRLPPAFLGPHGLVQLARPVRAYEVVSQLPAADPGRLRAATGQDPADPRWTALPGTLSPRVAALAREVTAGAATRYDAVVALERWLEENATYRLDPPVPGPGEDAVERFLLVDRTGYCQQFAAAHAVLLRSLGIPARVASGLGYGIDQGTKRQYQARHLHAWTEVHYPGVGWVASDPTPAAEVAVAGASVRDRVATALARSLRRVEDLAGGRAPLAALLVGLAAAAALAVRLRRRPRRDRVPAPAVAGGGPALRAYLPWDAALGPARRRPGESLAEQRARLAPPDDVRAALEAVEQECYAPAPPEGAERAAQVLRR